MSTEHHLSGLSLSVRYRKLALMLCVLALLLFVGVSFLASAFFTAHTLLRHSLPTTFIMGFDENKFNMVAVGDTFDKVSALVGKPMVISVEPPLGKSEVRLIREHEVSNMIESWKKEPTTIPHRMYFIYSQPAGDAGYEKRNLYIEKGIVKSKDRGIHWD